MWFQVQIGGHAGTAFPGGYGSRGTSDQMANASTSSRGETRRGPTGPRKRFREMVRPVLGVWGGRTGAHGKAGLGLPPLCLFVFAPPRSPPHICLPPRPEQGHRGARHASQRHPVRHPPTCAPRPPALTAPPPPPRRHRHVHGGGLVLLRGAVLLRRRQHHLEVEHERGAHRQGVPKGFLSAQQTDAHQSKTGSVRLLFGC